MCKHTGLFLYHRLVSTIGKEFRGLEKEKPIYFTQSEDEILAEFHTSPNGLSEEQAKKNLEKYGPNKLAEEKKKSLFAKFIDQFKDLMIVVLIVAAIIAAFSGEAADCVIILAVVILNAIFGVFQESKAEDAINALKEMSTPNAHVKRNGQFVTIKSDELVPGDIVLLEAGDVVPADIRLIEAASLKIEESALTGESVPVEKQVTTLTDPETSLGDRVNMAYMNSNVTYGRGVGVVVATGMNTEVGHIAGMLANADETQTPLKASLNQLGKILTVIVLAIAVIMFVVGVFVRGDNPLDMLLTSISLAVAAIPEGLPAIVTIILALGTQKMAKRHALVRKLPAVETLGATDIICSDKTGTLTMNKMTVEQLLTNNHSQEAASAVEPADLTVKIMSFCNDTKRSDTGELLGDPTETALIQFAQDKGFNVQEALKQEPRVAEVPFDSDRKLMSTIHQLSDGRFFVAVKGAPDELLKRCVSYNENGQTKAMTAEEEQFILSQNKQMATQALRVLAMAYKIVDQIPVEVTSEAIENDLIFAGLVGMIDPERKEAADAVKVAKDAGIRPIMITGDHRDTAEAIAVRLGIIPKGKHDAVITGAELDNMTDDEFKQKVSQYSVYARVSPEHKVKIVKAWQNEGKIVAMTGDGVNDAPALKTADIGIGMGITGTEVSKGASDMVLADDNFSTIVIAVEEGRKVFSNIQKTIQYLLSANLGEVITLFVATMLGWDTLLPVHLLWINLVTDTFPAIALGVEPAERDVMKHQPRGKKSNFFSGGVMSSILYQGVLEGAITLFVYWFAIHFPVHTSYEAIHSDALTMTFATLGLMQLFHAFNVKSIHGSLFKVGAFRNKTFNWAILLSFVLLAATIVVPGFNDLFHVAHLDMHQWLVVLISSFSIIPIVEVVKWIQRKTIYKD